MDLINTPMSRVSCRNDENPENQADQFLAFLPKFFDKNDPNLLRIFIIWTTVPWHGGVYKVHEKSRLRGYRNCYVGSLFSRHLIQPTFWLKMPKIDWPGLGKSIFCVKNYTKLSKKNFIEENHFRDTFFVIDIFWKIQFFKHFIFQNYDHFLSADFRVLLRDMGMTEG